MISAYSVVFLPSCRIAADGNGKMAESVIRKDCNSLQMLFVVCADVTFVLGTMLNETYQ